MTKLKLFFLRESVNPEGEIQAYVKTNKLLKEKYVKYILNQTFEETLIIFVF